MTTTLLPKIIIAGGNGFIGEFFHKKFTALGYDVKIISRQKPNIPWEDKEAIIRALEDSEMLINLAGRSVNCRYNEKNRLEILLSRTETTKKLGEAVLACKNPPKLWINSSTATIYRHAEDHAMTDSTGEIGSGFSIEVAKAWEKSFFHYQLPTTRMVALRIAIVLGKEGGALQPYKNLVRFRLGGKQGNGRQMFSWIHIEDLFNVISFIRERKDLSGTFNTSSPNPIPNIEFMKSLRKVMGIKIGLPAPKWLLKMGMPILRTETELVLKSRWVVPERLLKEGFEFQHPLIEETLRDLV